MRQPNRMFNTPQHCQAAKNGWFRIVNAKDAEPTKIYIYDFIGRDFWGDGITAASFVKELDNINGDVDLHVSSPGGDVDDAVAIRTALVNRKGKVVNYVDSIAASSASWIIMNGGKVVMAPASQLFAHNPSGGVYGEAKDLRAAADYMDAKRLDIAKMYADRSGKPVDTFLELMDKATYFSAEEAVAMGLADEVSPALRMAACAFDLSKFKLSNEFLKIQESLKKREAEGDLRDAGSSREEAKRQVSDQQRRDAAKRLNDQAITLLHKELQKCVR